MTTSLRRTPLFAEHEALGARLVDFGGWEMPVQYTSILKEHEAVRTAAGLFDVSHMGVFEVKGSDAEAAIQQLVPNNVKRLKDTGGLYTQLCQDDGGVIDDLLIFRWDATHYWLIVNAGNRDVDFAWIKEQLNNFASNLVSLADHTGILALQGPEAADILAVLGLDTKDLKAFQLRQVKLEVAGTSVHFTLSRSGYTGEDGFEMYVPHAHLVALWRALLTAGESSGLVPVGLGARDTLRLEAAMPLYGHELDRKITPLEAGLGWSVKLTHEDDFTGKAALVSQKESGLGQKRVGFVMKDSRRAPREGYSLFVGEQKVGRVTSGSLSPTLGYPIGMGYLEAPFFEASYLENNTLTLVIRDKHYPVEIVKMPFYRRKS